MRYEKVYCSSDSESTDLDKSNYPLSNGQHYFEFMACSQDFVNIIGRLRAQN